MRFDEVFPTFKTVVLEHWIDIVIEMNDCAAEGLTNRQAIQFSIRKFKKIKKIAEKLDPEVALYPVLGGETCPLCALYFNKNDSCEGCPVFKTTGLSACEGTPYMEQVWKANTAGSYVTACQAEIEFLESLL